ncbi:NADH-ubiquinone oxidoreductase-F iron-sulfur binding region domain-containing protein [Actinotalea fermentans]|uniref:NADH dehydrogenase n=1 Tax=Actinotalea fermentans TaxID=43671 RepID=A0A511Z101_9CELL|nr:NADH-ubiquinone oxidoreductase-F iron-sulfur binding region domain-containing protein [Actinotalea fermentans]GEN81124.1 NADH dehydrogenase [Actinotalea fermentans]
MSAQAIAPTRPLPTPRTTRARVDLLTAEVALPATGSWVLPAPAETLAEHTARFGARPSGSPHLLGLVEEAGLTGHGGGHVPVAAKWRRTLAGRGPLTVVANGAESEPWSAKDAVLLRQHPHLVLDGLALVAEALGAARAVVWLHDDAEPAAARALARALQERAAVERRGPAVEVLVGPEHYLSGESSAIVQAVAGGPALPTARRPRPAGGPRTLVHNVETLARVALAARGLPATTTRLLTVVGPAGRLVTEVAAGSPLLDALLEAGWSAGPGHPEGVLLGGYGGTWVAWADAARARIDADDPVGRLLGAGIVAPLAPGACPVELTASIAEYLAGMSAGQCGPCIFGLPAIAASVRRLADGRPARAELPRLAADLDAVAGRGACHHPDGAVGLVRSMAAVFGAHVAAHVRHGGCPAARGAGTGVGWVR